MTVAAADNISADPRGEGGQIVAQLNHEIAATTLTAFGLGFLVPVFKRIWEAAGYNVSDQPFKWVEMAVETGKRAEGKDPKEGKAYVQSAGSIAAAGRAYAESINKGRGEKEAQRAASDAAQKQAFNEGVPGVTDPDATRLSEGGTTDAPPDVPAGDVDVSEVPGSGDPGIDYGTGY